MCEYQEISVHGDLFNYELDMDLLLDYNWQMIDYVYKDRETSEIVQGTITADAIKYYRSQPIVKIQSVLSCKVDNQPVLMIIGLDGYNNNQIFWYNILTKVFTRRILKKPIKGDISQAYISPVPYDTVNSYKSSSIDSVHIMVVSTSSGQNTLIMACFNSWKPTLYQEEFTAPKDLGHATAIYILPAEDHPTCRVRKEPQIILGSSQGNILMYRLKSNMYAPRIKRLRLIMDISKFVEFPGHPITQLSSARLNSNEAVIVAFAQEKPIDDPQYQYSEPYIKLIEIHAGDLKVKRQKIINVPPSFGSPSIIEVKLIPTDTSISNSTLQLSVISTDHPRGQYNLNIWRITPDEVIEALSLQMDQWTCFGTIMDHSSVRDPLKFFPSGYLWNKPQKIASIILLNNQNKTRRSGRNKGSEQAQGSLKLKQEEDSEDEEEVDGEEEEERQVSPMKRVRKLTIIHKAANELSGHEEDNSSRRKRNKRNALPIVVAHDSLSSSEDEEDTSNVMATASSSLAVLEDDGTDMQKHVKQKDQINDTDEASQRHTQQSGVPETDLQQMRTHDSQSQQYQQLSANKCRPSLHENQLENQLETQNPIKNTHSIEDKYLDETKIQPTEQSKQCKSIEIGVCGSAKGEAEPKEIRTDKRTKVDLKPPEKYAYVSKVNKKINNEEVGTANMYKNDYGSSDIMDENDEYNDLDESVGEYNQSENSDRATSHNDDSNFDVTDDYLYTSNNNVESLVILSSDDEENEVRSQDDEEINDIVNHAVFEPLRIDQGQRESTSVVSEDSDPFMDHSLLNLGEIHFVPGGEFYIGTDQASTTTSTIPETESHLPSLDYIPVSDDELLRLLAGPVASDANVQEPDGANALPMTPMTDFVVNHSVETPALSVNFPTSTFPNNSVASSSSSSQSTTAPPMAEEENLVFSMSKIALDIAQMCFKTSEVDLDTLSSEKQDQMGHYCWESNDHRLKLFMMRYCHDHGMGQALVMLGRSLLCENGKGYMPAKEVKECKSLLKHHLFNVHPSLRSGAIINPFSEQSRRDMLQMRSSYYKQKSNISSSIHQPKQDDSYVDYYGFGFF